MNTKGLAKHYDKLTPWERVPLLIAAEARGDEAEQQWLAHSAPMSLCSVSDFRGLSEGLRTLAHGHMMAQLDLAAWYWRISAVLAECLRGLKQEAAKPHEERLWNSLRLLAYRFVVGSDAWERLCGELGIDPHALLRDCPGFDTIQSLEEQARMFAFSAEAAAQYVQQRDSQAQLSTVKAVVVAMREALQRCAPA